MNFKFYQKRQKLVTFGAFLIELNYYLGMEDENYEFRLLFY